MCHRKHEILPCGQFDCLYPKTLAKRKRKKNTQISKNNNLEVKAEFDDSIKLLNHDRLNVVNTNSLFCKTDLMRCSITVFSTLMTLDTSLRWQHIVDFSV